MTHSSLKLARSHVQKLREALSRPTPAGIEECLPGLAEAVDCLRRVETNLSTATPQEILEIRALSSGLKGARRLIDRGAAFYKGWANVLGAASAGYTPDGAAAPIPAEGKVLVRG